MTSVSRQDKDCSVVLYDPLIASNVPISVQLYIFIIVPTVFSTYMVDIFGRKIVSLEIPEDDNKIRDTKIYDYRYLGIC